MIENYIGPLIIAALFGVIVALFGAVFITGLITIGNWAVNKKEATKQYAPFRTPWRLRKLEIIKKPPCKPSVYFGIHDNLSKVRLWRWL
jgi:hypothetical protein